MPLWDTAEATLCWLADCFIFLIWINKPAEKVKMCRMWVIALRRIQGFSQACGWTHNINITRAPLLLPSLLLSLQHNLIYLPVEHPNKAQWGVLHYKNNYTNNMIWQVCDTKGCVQPNLSVYRVFSFTFSLNSSCGSTDSSRWLSML